MAKTVVIFNVSKTSNYLDDAKYSLEQIKIIDYADVLGSCLWTSYMSRYEDDPYINVNHYPVWSEIKDCVEKRDWAEVYKLGKKFTSKVVKTKDLEMHGECAIKSYMNTLNYDNLFAIVTSEKPKVIMQFLADAINERIDDNDFSWDLKWQFHSKNDKENTIVMEFPKYKLKLIPCNNAYQYYNMENYYDELDFEVYDDKKLYENKTMKKSIKESTNIFDTLEKAWDKTMMNNNVFEKTVLKLKTDSFKDPFDKYSTIYMFADDSSIDCDSLDPFNCNWCTYVSEDLSFVHEFKK